MPARQRLIVQIVSPLAGIGLFMAILAWNALSLSDADQHVERIDAGLIELYSLEARINRQFAGVALHLASGSEQALVDYRDLGPTDAAFRKVRDLVGDNAGQRARVDAALDRYKVWRKFADSEINQVLAGRSQLGAMRRNGESVERAVVDAFNTLYRVQLQLQTEWAARAVAARHLVFILIAVGGLLLAVGLAVLGGMQVSSLATEDAARYQRLADEHANATREHSQIRTELGELRRGVREKTAALKAATSQLEALTYAVSRHLRGRLEQAEALLREVYYESLGDRVDRDALHQLAQEVSSAQRLQEALLLYARLTRIDLSLDRVDLNEILDTVLAELQTEISRTCAQVSVAARLPEVQGNRAVLMQVFGHLLANAVRFGADTEPKIRVWAQPADGVLRVWVEDNGVGIAPKDHERIFKLFERVHTDNNDQGIGIGLAIVRLAAERLGGRVGVESVLEQGSRFWVELPLAS